MYETIQFQLSWVAVGLPRVDNPKNTSLPKCTRLNKYNSRLERAVEQCQILLMSLRLKCHFSNLVLNMIIV